MHKQNFEKIRVETKKILEELIKLTKENNDGKQSERTNQLQEEKVKFVELEFSVAVVGTMKAGKSTTINAIVGQEILPNRTDAMTSIPTVVTHKKGQKEPKLSLHSYQVFNDLITEIKSHKINEQENFDKATKKVLKEIKEKLTINENYLGRAEIFEALRVINDLMRVAKVVGVEAPYSKLKKSSDFPKIEVEFSYLQDKEDLSNAKFSLMDTPGPKEFGQSEELRAIADTQIKNASAVMLVVDYTQISGESSHQLKEQVEQAIKFLGKDKIFILLNKFDEDTKQGEKKGYAGAIDDFINKFSKGSFDEGKIFPISGRDAFYASLGLTELRAFGKIDKTKEWVETFGKIVIGRRWEKTISDKDEVIEYCNDALDDSYFNKPMKDIIDFSYKNSKFGVVESALYTIKGLNKEFKDETNTAINAYTVTLSQLEEEIRTIKEDTQKIKTVSADITESFKREQESIEKDIQSILSEKTEEFNNKIDVFYNNALDDISRSMEESTSYKIKEQHDKKWAFMGHTYGTKGMEKKQEEALKKVLTSFNELKKKGEIIFDSENEKNNFMKVIQTISNDSLNHFYEETASLLHEKIKQFIPNINKSISEKIKSIIEDIQKNLSSNVIFKQPKIEIDIHKKEVSFNAEESIENSSETRIRMVEQEGLWGGIKRGVDFFDWDLGLDSESYSVKIFKINYNKIKEKMNDAIIRLAKQVSEDIDEEFNKKIKKPIEEDFKNIIIEIEHLRSIKDDVLKKRQADEGQTQEMLSLAVDRLRKIEKLDGRQLMVEKIMGEGINE